MKDANDNILKVLTNNVQESVDFLEKCLKQLDHDLAMPTSDCFGNINPENGSYELIWKNGRILEIDEIRNSVCISKFVNYL